MTNETVEPEITAAGNEVSASFLAAKKRSDETMAALEANPGKFTMLTGDRPTGRLHLGHYFGSIRERVAMQERGVNTNIIIADYQVITDRDTTEHIDDNVLNLVLDYMAAGIDPAKTMIFTHSAVPAENQLMLPFLSLVTEAELHRNPTVKSEMEASGHALTGLLLTYPVHQACDILFCKANVVPIGKDNLPHVEITRTIARRFNERYAKKHPVFPEPAAILSEAPEIPGLDGRKMSKSYGNSIMLGATAEETAKLIKPDRFRAPHHLRPDQPSAGLRAADHRRSGDRPRPAGNRRGDRRRRCRRAEEVRHGVGERVPGPAPRAPRRTGQGHGRDPRHPA